MYFRQFYLSCLAHASYMIGDEGEVAVIDPQRDVDIYLEEAERDGLQIRHVIETHLHADFVSGHRELAQRTGAKIYYGHRAGVRFEHVPVRDGDELQLGKLRLRFLETPGHTPESICVVVVENGQPVSVFAGDTLFIGDVGRPDLLGHVMSAAELAGMLYDSLHGKLLKLPDFVKVYPAHGAGSMCGRSISSEKSSTIGEQRKTNYALQPMTREEFIRMMTTDLPEAPAYFSQDARINRQGPALLDQLPMPEALSPRQVKEKIEQGCVLLDTRPSDQYGAAHVPGSLQIGLSGQYASWAGTLIPLNTPLILLAENEERVHESRIRLARVGHENVIGYLKGGILSWYEAGFETASTEQITVLELNQRIAEKQAGQLIDVRRPGEWKAGHIPSALHLPLNQLMKTARTLDPDKPVTAICAGGYRSSIATSILEQQGFQKITNVIGGMTAWRNANLEMKAD